MLGLVAVGEVHEHRVAGGALDQRADRGLVVFAEQQVAFPVTGDRAVVGFLGALGDVDHVGDPVAALTGSPSRLAQRAAGPQAGGQLAFERAAGGHIQRLVDRLARHPHLRVGGEPHSQSRRDLRRRVLACQVLLDDLAQRRVDRKLGRLGTLGSLPGQRVRAAGAILPPGVGVAAQLARDRRWGATQPPRDPADRLTAGSEQHDLLTLGERQAAALEMPAAAGADPASGRDPPPALLPIGADLLGGIGDRLTPRQRPPRRRPSPRAASAR